MAMKTRAAVLLWSFGTLVLATPARPSSEESPASDCATGAHSDGNPACLTDAPLLFQTRADKIADQVDVEQGREGNWSKVTSVPPPFEDKVVKVTITMSTPHDLVDRLVEEELEKMNKTLNSFDLSHSEFPDSEEDSEPPPFPLTFSVLLKPRKKVELEVNMSSGESEETMGKVELIDEDLNNASDAPADIAGELIEEEDVQMSAADMELLQRSQAAVDAVSRGEKFEFGMVDRARQSKWVAIMLSKLMKKICRRGSRPKSISWRSCRMHDWRGWWQRRRHGPHCDGWVDTPTFPPCCEHCGHRGNGVMNTCVGCRGWFEGPFACWEPCGARGGLPQMPDNCGTLYCAADGGTCFSKGAQIAMAFASVIENFLPSRGALTAAKTAVKQSAKRGDAAWRRAMAGMKVILKDKAIEMRRKYQDKLAAYMKGLRREMLVKIIEDGAEGLLAAAEAKRDAGLAPLAMEFAEAVDPTGLVGLVNSFTAEGCGEQRISPMPREGLIPSDNEVQYFPAHGHSYAQSKALCTAHGRILCRMLKICPDGVHSHPIGGDLDAWAPIGDRNNDWVSIGALRHWRCAGHYDRGFGLPAWGHHHNAHNKRIFCCPRDPAQYFAGHGRSYAQSQSFCQSRGMVLCKKDQICPDGMHSHPVGGDIVGWSPMADRYNDWVITWHEPGHWRCASHWDRGFPLPPWGYHHNHHNKRIYCCPRDM